MKTYTVGETAQILGVCKHTVYKLIKRGCFQSVKIDHQHRIIKTSLDDWINNG